MMTWVAQANRMEVPNSSTSAQWMMYRPRRAGLAHDVTGDTANPGYAIHPFTFSLGCHALYRSPPAVCGRGLQRAD